MDFSKTYVSTVIARNTFRDAFVYTEQTGGQTCGVPIVRSHGDTTILS